MNLIGQEKGNNSLFAKYGQKDGLPFSFMKCGWEPMATDDFGNAYRIFDTSKCLRDWPYMSQVNCLSLQG